MSTYLSAIETTIPPMIEGSTFAVSWMVSLDFTNFFSCASRSLRWEPSKGFAVMTSQTTSPRLADMISLKALMMLSNFFNLPFSARSSNKKPVATLNLTLLETSFKAAALILRLIVGLRMKSRNFGSCLNEFWKLVKSFSTASNALVFEAAENNAEAYRPSIPKTWIGGLISCWATDDELMLRA